MKKSLLLIAVALLFAGCGQGIFKSEYQVVSEYNFAPYKNKTIQSIIPVSDSDAVIFVFTDGTSLQIITTYKSNSSVAVKLDYNTPVVEHN
jgi:hypothetical protein